MWDEDLYTHLSNVYRLQAKYTVMFISKHYREKLWTNHERKAAQARAFEENREYILPARFDDMNIPGILPTTGFIDLRLKSPVDVAYLICQKIGINPTKLKAHQLPPPRNPALQGTASFNFSNYNKRFCIGEGVFEFETRWSGASDTLIHCYTDSPSVRAVALAPKGVSIQEIPPVEQLDFTSRVRTPEIGRFVILQNHNGIYAVLRINQIQMGARGAKEDWLVFDYWILTDGSSLFSELSDSPYT